MTPASGGTLVDDDDCVVWLLTGAGPVFASGPSRGEVAEVWQVRLPRHLFVPSGVAGAHDAIVATTTMGLNQFNDVATCVGVMPLGELAIGVVSEPVMPPPG